MQNKTAGKRELIKIALRHSGPQLDHLAGYCRVVAVQKLLKRILFSHDKVCKYLTGKHNYLSQGQIKTFRCKFICSDMKFTITITVSMIVSFRFVPTIEI